MQYTVQDNLRKTQHSSQHDTTQSRQRNSYAPQQNTTPTAQQAFNLFVWDNTARLKGVLTDFSTHFGTESSHF